MKVRNTKGIANPQFKTSGLQIRWNRVGISIYQGITANTTDAKLEYSIDAIIGSAAVLKPEIFGIPATLWFLGGKQVTYWYGNKVITPMIQEGINPGLMINQPFK